MLLWKAVTIENCAACHVHSQGLCYMWIHVKRPLNINTTRAAARFQGSDCESACWKITWRKRNYETKSSMATFLKLFDIHATYCYLQVDLKSFVASRAFFLSREATERATISQAINSRHSWLFDCKSTETRNQHQQVALLGHLDNIFSRPRPRLAPLDLAHSLYSSSR